MGEKVKGEEGAEAAEDEGEQDVLDEMRPLDDGGEYELAERGGDCVEWSPSPSPSIGRSYCGPRRLPSSLNTLLSILSRLPPVCERVCTAGEDEMEEDGESE